MYKYFKADIPEGMHLADSKKHKGSKRGILMSNKTNKIVGHTELTEIDHPPVDIGKYQKTVENYEKSMSDFSQAASSAIGALTGLAIASMIEQAARQEAESSKAALRSRAWRHTYDEGEEIAERIKQKRIEQELELERVREQRAIRQSMQRERRNKILLGIIIAIGKAMWWILKHLGIALWFIIKHIGLGIGWACSHFFKSIFNLIKTSKAKKHEQHTKQIQNIPTSKIHLNSLSAKAFKEQLSQNAPSHNKSSTSTLKVSMASDDYSIIVDQICDDFDVFTLDEEKQIHLINIFILSIQLANEIKALYATTDENLANNPDYIKWQQSMERMASKKIIYFINEVIKTNSKIIQQEKLDQIISTFQAGKYVNGIYIPIRQKQVEELLPK